jgi:hypothetical protein
LTDPSFDIAWAAGGTSTGITKIKSSGVVGRNKAVLVITAGKHAPDLAGEKAKLKATFDFTPTNGGCADGNRTTSVSIAKTTGTNVIIQET